MKKFGLLICLILLGSFTKPIYADGIGLTVSGFLSVPTYGSGNYFDSINGAVPSGYGNSGATNGSAVIGSGIEFAATNGQDLLTIDFTGTTVTVVDTCVGGWMWYDAIHDYSV